jgi:bacillithiol synthase
MTTIRSTIPMTSLSTGALYRAFIAGKDGIAKTALGGFHAGAPAWKAFSAPAPALDARLVARLVEYNTALGVDASVIERLEDLGAGAARAVVTGQQPGVAGGPLMTLYKIATAGALAREIERRTRTRCVPVFWLGSDDDDFAEIREFAAISRDMSIVSASLPASAYSPGQRIGDISADAVREVMSAVAPFLPGGADPGETIGDASDLGEAAARTIVAMTGGEVAIVDGREAVLRECARDLILGYYDTEASLRARIDRAGDALVASGYHAQLEPGSSSGVFYVENGIRQRVPEDRRDAVRRELERDITPASPGVVARNLVQDSVFRPAAVVLGPAEIAYRAQLADVYDALAVDRPMVFPRLSATFIPPPLVDVVAAAGADVTLLATDPIAWVERAHLALEDKAFAGAADRATASFREALAGFIATAKERLDDRARGKLEKRLAEIEQRLQQALAAAVEQDTRGAAARWPFLSRSHEIFRRDGASQERYLSLIVPHAYHGRAAWDTVKQLAVGHVEDALDGRVGHRVYSI